MDTDVTCHLIILGSLKCCNEKEERKEKRREKKERRRNKLNILMKVEFLFETVFVNRNRIVSLKKFYWTS